MNEEVNGKHFCYIFIHTLCSTIICSEMFYRIEWEAFDYHSGLDSVSWKLYDSYGGSDVVYGKEDIVAQGNSTVSNKLENVTT